MYSKLYSGHYFILHPSSFILDKMQKIKTTLQNLPKHTQWLLLGVAFLVVIVLLFLLLGNREPATGNQQPATSNQEPVVLTITPDKINWQNSAGGDTKNATVEIRANIPTIVSGADFTTAVPKLTRTGTCAETAQQITDKIPCIIRIEWTADDVEFDAKTELAF
ncbi:MAG: hypothetical protein LBR41_02620, partial [Rickettsiales bacterium]|nr:hypothetical protein [Rickettsiales bacterium]